MIDYEEVKGIIIGLINQNGDETTKEFMGRSDAISWLSDKGLPNILLGLIKRINEEFWIYRDKINEIINKWNEKFPNDRIEPLET